MKRRASFAFLTTLLLVVTWGLTAANAPSALAKGTAGKTLVAQLSGDQEVPPVTTRAHGTAHLRVSKDGSTVSYKVLVNKPSSPVVAAHIHRAPEGTNGPVVVSLFPGDDLKVNRNLTMFSGTFPMSAYPDLVADADAGLLYVNVHTQGVPSGEVRGQLS